MKEIRPINIAITVVIFFVLSAVGADGFQPSSSTSASISSLCRKSRGRQPIETNIFCNNSNDDLVVDDGGRRQFLVKSVSYASSIVLFPHVGGTVKPAHGSGLIQFPLTSTDQQPLKNIYHLMRAGTTLLEEEDIYCSNPLGLTNRDAALSDAGRQQVLDAANMLQRLNVQPSQIRHSLASSAMDTAQIIKQELRVGQNRVNPEFVFMDPRAVGLWDGLSQTSVRDAIIAYDVQDAHADGTGGRPPSNDDGTPNETLFDQRTRLVQLMSGLETQYSGDNILLVFPDATGPALLSCLMSGVPLNDVHLLDFDPGEVRLNVTPETIVALLQQRMNDSTFMKAYQTRIQHGQDELERLLVLDPTTLVSKKDQLIMQEQQAIEEQILKKKQEVQQKQELLNKQVRKERQQQMEEEAAGRRRRREQEEEKQQQQQQLLPTTTTAANNSLDLKVATISTSLAFSGAIAVFAGGASSSSIRQRDYNGYSEDQTQDLLSHSSPSVATMAGNESTKPSSLSRSLASAERTQIDTATTIKDKCTADGYNTDDNRNESHTIGGSPLSSTSSTTPGQPQTLEEKKEAADMAMEQYMNRDDGGEDWLHLMEEILLEDDDIVDSRDNFL
jgi:broad specificity phosphatase PhoE